MSNLYKTADDVPNKVLCERLKELSNAITKGIKPMLREFNMRVPAELDRDADLVLSIAAKRIKNIEELELKLENHEYLYHGIISDRDHANAKGE